MAVVNGRSPLGDFATQYASLWPYATAAAMRVLGTSVLGFTLAMALLRASMLALFDVLRRLTRSSASALLLFLPLLATSAIRLPGSADVRFSLVTYYGTMPLRYAGPFLLAWLLTATSTAHGHDEPGRSCSPPDSWRSTTSTSAFPPSSPRSRRLRGRSCRSAAHSCARSHANSRSDSRLRSRSSGPAAAAHRHAPRRLARIPLRARVRAGRLHHAADRPAARDEHDPLPELRRGARDRDGADAAARPGPPADGAARMERDLRPRRRRATTSATRSRRC